MGCSFCSLAGVASKVLEPRLIVVGTTVPRGISGWKDTEVAYFHCDTIHSHFLAEADINPMPRRADRPSPGADHYGRFITRRGIVSSSVRSVSPASDRAFIAAGYRSPAKCSLRSHNVAAAEWND